MKISKTRLKEIIKEELSTVRESDWYDDENETRADRKYADSQAGLGDLQSDEKFTGGSSEEQMNILINARDVLSKMSDEKLEELSKSLDAAQTAALRHLLANPMYAPMEEGWKEFAQGAKDLGRDVSKLRKPGTSKKIRQDATAAGIAYDEESAADDARYAKNAARRQSDEKARSARRDADYRGRSRDLEDFTQSQKDQRRRAQKKKEDDLRHSGGPSNRRVSRTTYQEQ